MATAVIDGNSYALGHSESELDRLSAQAEIFEPATRELLLAAGLRPGMRVLDVGCGAGDVAFLASEIVGPEGQVVAVDRAPEALARASGRARGRRIENILFEQGDPAELEFQCDFDAVIGRLVLMYYAEPTEAVRRLAGKLRSGGVMVFQELDGAGCFSWPPSPTYDSAIYLIRKALEFSGAPTRLGLRLFSIFQDAGLPAPEMRLSGALGGGEDHPVYSLIAESLRSLLPVLKKFDVASAEQLDIDSLAARMRQEMIANRSVATSPTLIGAWARK